MAVTKSEKRRRASPEKTRPSIYWLLACIALPPARLMMKIRIQDGHKLPVSGPFVLAPNQFGTAPPHFDSFGRSAIVDPWGVVLATAPDEECFIAADLDLEAQDRVRTSLPSLANRRPRAYVWPQLTEARA